MRIGPFKLGASEPIGTPASVVRPDVQAWTQRTADRPGLIRLILLDVDGCLTEGEGAPLDLPVLQLIAGLNRRSLDEPDLPAVTLCTGRQAPYVELLCQAIDAFVPAIWETGAGLFIPSEYRFLTHPSFTPERLAALAEVRRLIRERVERPGLGDHQAGKELSVTVYGRPGVSLDELHAVMLETLAPYAEHYTVHRQLSGVEALPNDIDKGGGARWISELVGLPLERMAGVGDQTPDLSYLSIVGVAAVPANATPDLRAKAAYVAPNRTSKGVIDILNWVVARNRAGA